MALGLQMRCCRNAFTRLHGIMMDRSSFSQLKSQYIATNLVIFSNVDLPYEVLPNS